MFCLWLLFFFASSVALGQGGGRATGTQFQGPSSAGGVGVDPGGTSNREGAEVDSSKPQNAHRVSFGGVSGGSIGGGGYTSVGGRATSFRDGSGGPTDISDTPDPGLVELLFACALLGISLFLLLDATVRRNRRAKFGTSFALTVFGPIIVGTTLLGLSWYWFFYSMRLSLPYNSVSWFEIVFSYPRHFSPGIWVASFIFSAFALHHFFTTAFDLTSGSEEEGESESRAARTESKIVPVVQMAFSFAAFLVSLLRITEYFGD